MKGLTAKEIVFTKWNKLAEKIGKIRNEYWKTHKVSRVCLFCKKKYIVSNRLGRFSKFCSNKHRIKFWRKKNPKRNKIISNRYYQKNKKKILKYQNKWFKKRYRTDKVFREKMSKYWKIYHKKNRSK